MTLMQPQLPIGTTESDKETAREEIRKNMREDGTIRVTVELLLQLIDEIPVTEERVKA